MATKKKPPQATSYDRQLQRLVARFEEATGAKAVNLDDVVLWAEQKGEFQVTVGQMRKKFARDLARALSKEYIENDDGEPVRKRQPFRTETQLTLWKMIDDMSPDEMRVSYQITRSRVGGEVFQKQRDIDYYNKKINPGDPIETSWDYDSDINDRKHSTEYHDGTEETH